MASSISQGEKVSDVIVTVRTVMVLLSVAHTVAGARVL
jgi:hypothetical protein